MTLFLDDETGGGSGLPLNDIFKQVAEEVLRQEGCPYDCEISLSIVGKERIRELNSEFRGIDKITDVLSFPLLDYACPGDFDGIEESAFNPDTGELLLGDIVICMDVALSQAEEYGHSATREFAFLIAHSMLHLLGFDHMEKEDERLMTEKQERALSSLGIKR